ncbi:hypothetical protein L1049_005416 [Liquidambar formosana]|uniref:F-box domain-containing protein n=1 Tax=Liquidambar formosana TaxID=63359 RepID=A0AAP0RU97_LIQFO
MGLIPEILSYLLSNVIHFIRYNARLFSIPSNKRERRFAIMGNEREQFKVDANRDDMLVALLPEVRELIIQKLDIVDYYRLSAVCKLWRSTAIAAKQSQCFSLRQLQWLLLSFNRDDPPAGCSSRGFQSLPWKKFQAKVA